MKLRFGFLVVLAFFCGSIPRMVGGEPLSYNRDIRPMLSDNCFFCHGPDENERKGKLRLDVREDAVAAKAIVPGNPDESELIKRIFTTDPDDLMPPAESHKKLSERQKQALRTWIEDGAKYEGHWSYALPIKAEVPSGKNGIDHLVQERLENARLKPSPEADRRTLARRLYFDLLGLPPTPEEVERFTNDSSPEAYAALVEKLLSSPHYGERMALGWLDVVRFADTIGYHSDNPRNIWPYRDYVIESFNENKRFDQFTIEQIAGDLLPGSTLEQKVGSAFNRLILSTEEGGAQEKDYEARMLTDRVRAIGTVWLGQTIGCAQCHDHKFDPILARDFYAMGAFFADIKEPIIGRREDGILVPNEDQERELTRLESEIAKLQGDYDSPHPELKEAFEDWTKSQVEALDQARLWTSLKPVTHESVGGAKLELQSDNSVLAKGKKPEKDTYNLTFGESPNPISAVRIDALPDDSLPSKGPGRAGNGNFVITEVVARVIRANGDRVTVPFVSAKASIEQTFAAEEHPYKKWAAAATIDGDAKGETWGWAVLPEVGRVQSLVLELREPVKFEPGDALSLEIRQNLGNGHHTLGKFRVSGSSSYDLARKPILSSPPKEIADLLAGSAETEDSGSTAKLFAYYKTIAPGLADLRSKLAAAGKAKKDYEGTVPRCIVSVSSDKPRTVRILPRGNFLIETGEIVKPALPIYLTKHLSTPEEPTRLDLAQWLVSRDNPLTARVVMNRLWKQFFGIGLAKVLDDFGAQGEPPPNQALLDWLACEFMDSGWDMKRMVRLIVNSDTYKQSSNVSKELRSEDPDNRFLAAQSRWRLDAELVRDNALSFAGLLVPKIGGPSVKPYQPDGYWENLNFPPRKYEASQGEDQYRRGMYTWWQRSFVHPSMLAFDAPTREECAAERNRSNIPQQALVLLNDPTYVEASRAFAARILEKGGNEVASRIQWAWEQALQRKPSGEELATVQELLQKHLADYQKDVEAAKQIISVGNSPAPSNLDKSELAAWTSVARLILNLHETITRS